MVAELTDVSNFALNLYKRNQDKKKPRKKKVKTEERNIQPTASMLFCSTDAITDRVKKKKKKTRWLIYFPEILGKQLHYGATPWKN